MDNDIVCVDCSTVFLFTEGEQRFYAERGFQTPKRCPACRAVKRAARGSAGPSSTNADKHGGTEEGGLERRRR
jgi:hypothetical protein